MERQIKRVVTLVIGWTLIAIGIVGLFLPFLQGILLIFLGLYLLSRESETARRWFERGRRRYPRIDAKLKKWRQWWRRRLGRSTREENGNRDR
jgi:uncharacterized membrane protein YbaN (DUF454 family)